MEVGGDAIAEHGVGAGDVLAACRRREVGGQLGEHHEHAAHGAGGTSSGVAAPEVKAGHSSWRRDREAEVDHAAHKGQVA